MEKPLVTVFMTAFNSEKYIRESIESIIKQSYENLEVIIIDDGSTDSTPSIIESFKDHRIRFIRNKTNLGIAVNRKKGIDIAQGKYMVIMDSDDISVHDRILEQVNYMESHKEIVAAGTFTKHFGKKINNRIVKQKLGLEEIKITLLFSNCIINSSAIIHLDELRRLNINYNPNYFVAQDYDLWANISKKGAINNIPKVLVKYRFGHNNITKISMKNKVNQRKEIISSIRNNLLDYYNFNLSNEEKIIFNSFFDETASSINKSNITNVKKIIDKLLISNKVEKIFKEEIFLKVVEEEIEKCIKKANIGFFNKYKFWRILSEKSGYYVVCYSFYYSILRSLHRLNYLNLRR